MPSLAPTTSLVLIGCVVVAQSWLLVGDYVREWSDNRLYWYSTMDRNNSYEEKVVELHTVMVCAQCQVR